MGLVEPAQVERKRTLSGDLREWITAANPRSRRLVLRLWKPERTVRVVGLDGVLDIATSALLRRAIDDVASRASVLVDLSRLTFHPPGGNRGLAGRRARPQSAGRHQVACRSNWSDCGCA